MVMVAVIEEGIQIGGEGLRVHLTVLSGDCEDLVACVFHGSCLMHRDMACLYGDHSVEGFEHRGDDGGVGLRSAAEEEDVSLGVADGFPYFRFGAFRKGVGPVTRALHHVRLHESFQNPGMRSLGVVAYE